MTSKDAIEKIKHLLFGQQSFGLMKTKEGMEMQVEGDVELEKEIYIITPEGMLPAEDGDYEMEDGMKIKVEAAKVKSMNYTEHEDDVTEMEDEVEVKVEEDETKMVSAELIDGTIVETDTEELKVGDSLFVVTDEGRSIAPDGDHETKDGNIVSVLDGVVTEIKVKEEVIEEELNMDEVIEVFTKSIEHLSNELNSIKENQSKMQADFNKFSAQPAGEKVYDHRGEYINHLKSKQFSKLEALKALKTNKIKN